MTVEQRRLYDSESKKEAYRREKDAQVEKDIQTATQRTSWKDYDQRNLEELVPEFTYKQEMEYSQEASKLVHKILDEVKQDPDVDRIDAETVRTVGILNYGFEQGCILANPAGLFVSARFLDLSVCSVIDAVHNPLPCSAIPRYDRPWHESPSFLAAYKKLLDSSLRLCRKHDELTERNLVVKIQEEWNSICEKEFSL
jgi:hypothetical protein